MPGPPVTDFSALVTDTLRAYDAALERTKIIVAENADGNAAPTEGALDRRRTTMDQPFNVAERGVDVVAGQGGIDSALSALAEQTDRLAQLLDVLHERADRVLRPAQPGERIRSEAVQAPQSSLAMWLTEQTGTLRSRLDTLEETISRIDLSFS